MPVFQTQRAGQAIEIIRDLCRKDPCAEIHIYGGDGSVFEAANAIMSADTNSTTTLVVHPFGTGNDFARNFPPEKQNTPQKIDLIRFNDRFAVNEINIGFDCDVVALTQKIKKIPLFRGSIAYMISVLLTLFKKMGRQFDITVTDEHGNTETIQKELLLCLSTNGGYYGGGFNCAPRASLDDGLMEFFCVKKVSRLKFLFFFLGYRNGKHINPDGTVHRKYADFLQYKRAKSVQFYHVGHVCADGEIFHCDSLFLSVENKILNIQVESPSK